MRRVQGLSRGGDELPISHLWARRRLEEEHHRDDGGHARGECDECEQETRRHAICLPPRARSAAPASTSATAPSARATIESVEVPPPPTDDTVFTTGAGVSADSGPDQSTTDPSE